MDEPKLYMLLLGCRPKGRLTEQHDLFFGIGSSLKSLVPHIQAFWPEAKNNIHLDAWREVTVVDDHLIKVIAKTEQVASQKLFFLNLGGYKVNEFEEYHYKLLNLAPNIAEAIKAAKQSTFYKHTGFTGAASHIDDKYGVDVDEAHEVAEILPAAFKEQYSLEIVPGNKAPDALHLGYVPLWKIKD